MANEAVIGAGENIFVVLTKLVSLELALYLEMVILRDVSLLYFVFKILDAQLRPPLPQQLRHVCNFKSRHYLSV